MLRKQFFKHFPRFQGKHWNYHDRESKGSLSAESKVFPGIIPQRLRRRHHGLQLVTWSKREGLWDRSFLFCLSSLHHVIPPFIYFLRPKTLVLSLMPLFFTSYMKSKTRANNHKYVFNPTTSHHLHHCHPSSTHHHLDSWNSLPVSNSSPRYQFSTKK